MNVTHGWNRDVIKLIAMGTMLLNHIATIFMEPGTFLYELFLDIGYFTAITMCYFLVEGYRYTHSKKRYGFRLFLFALLSQIPFSLAFSDNGKLQFSNLNMLFTLFICFLIVCAVKEIPNRMIGRNLAVLLTLCTIVCDWALFAAIFTQLFLWAEESESKKRKAYLWAVGLFGVFTLFSGIGRFSGVGLFFYAVGATAGVALSAYCILYWYNGRRMQKGKKFFQWFFYLFYPCHLLILWWIRWILFS